MQNRGHNVSDGPEIGPLAASRAILQLRVGVVELGLCLPGRVSFYPEREAHPGVMGWD